MDTNTEINKVDNNMTDVNDTQMTGKADVKAETAKKKIRILLLTNRDSDNIGDQVIEQSDIALIKAVMKNLGFRKEDFQISSRAAALITKKYIATKNESLLKTAREAIKNCDMIIFGGAPVFNFLYQEFYERTAVTLELAKEYNKPVIFSAIGVEGYDDNNAKCQRLKKTLNFDIVKQITTRDDFEKLQKYKEREELVIDKVSDPAVFCASVFADFIKKKTDEPKKKIGIFVLRANGFEDNKFNFSRNDAAKLWLDLAKELEEKGYDYEFITSGHFGDECFLDYLIRNCDLDAAKCVFNMNKPEDLFEQMSTYDGVISCRLHPSIISFSMDIPSLGIVWNHKVTGFYESMNYGDRVVSTENINAKDVVERLEKAMEEGVVKDKKYLASVYSTLFNGIKKIVAPDNTAAAYDYDEIIENLPLFAGTSEKEKGLKLRRKFRRAYGKYNDNFIRKEELTKDVKVKDEIIREKTERIKVLEEKYSATEMDELFKKIKELEEKVNEYKEREEARLSYKIKQLFKK